MANESTTNAVTNEENYDMEDNTMEMPYFPVKKNHAILKGTMMTLAAAAIFGLGVIVGANCSMSKMSSDDDMGSGMDSDDAGMASGDE